MDNGKAFEFGCLLGLEEYLHSNSNGVSPILENNSSFHVAKSYFDKLLISDPSYASKLKLAGNRLGEILRKLEPKLFQHESSSRNEIKLLLQPDSAGIAGDVRDILAIKMKIANQENWQIGISCKHNHDAVRHQRVSPTIDFGKEWLDLPLQDAERNNISVVFNQIDELREAGISKWSEVVDKDSKFYIPILDIITNKISLHPDKMHLATYLLNYLIGSHDFYKLVFHVNGSLLLQGFNFKGTLNLPAEGVSPTSTVNKLHLPTRLINVGYKPNSKTTIELFFDHGWQIAMRIHNASTNLEKSLKMDVRLTGTPPGLFTYSDHV